MWYIVSTKAAEKICRCVSRNYLTIFSEKLYYMWEMCKFAHSINIKNVLVTTFHALEDS